MAVVGPWVVAPPTGASFTCTEKYIKVYAYGVLYVIYGNY